MIRQVGLAYHFIKRRVPSLPRDLCFAFGGFVGVWEKVGFHIWVWVCSVI